MPMEDGFNSIVSRLKEKLEGLQDIGTTNHIAVHVNVTDMGNRSFYIEVSDGVIHVEPYGYYNNDVVINADSVILWDMIEKRLDIKHAQASGRIGVFGDFYKLAEIRDIFIRMT